ncbi:MAG: hypothetical protein JO250_14755 [Armatimonadetes bacterium]|nr:hypothetical protein [Armatimonadota bacterium]
MLLPAAGGDWQDADTTADVFQGRVGYTRFRATLPDMRGPRRLLVFASTDDEGTVYLNGRRGGGPHVLAVLVRNTAGAGGLLGKVTLEGGLGSGIEIRGWRMQGGETPPPVASPAWRSLPGNDAPGVPAFYRAEFTATPPGAVGPHPILRASLAGLSRGFMRLNGHNLGRYPEKSPTDGVYLQECWLNPGKNTLTVFDEDGNSPSQVKSLSRRPAAGA